jgi:ribonuclease J
MEMTIGANPEAFRTVFRACRKAGRTLVVDLYTDTIAKATGRDSIPRSGFSGLKVYVPQSQRLKVKQSKQFFRVNGLRNHRIYPEQLAQQPGKYAVIFRSSMIRDSRHFDDL